MTMKRLIVVRSDGVSHSSDFSGWHSETGAFHFFNEAKADKRTLYAAVLEGDNEKSLSLRSEYHAQETTK